MSLTRRERYVLLGDGESPHLLKWARALAPQVDLWAASSRGFASGFDAIVGPERRLSLATRPDPAGGNFGLLGELPRLARWLHDVQAEWIHAHYLTSHGVLAWAAHGMFRAPGRLVGSAWGSDILVAPARSATLRWITSRVLRACTLTTSDSCVMAARMRELGAREVMVFPFGLEALPEESLSKEPWLFFANRGLEPIYAPQRVLASFAEIAKWQPDARLVIANDGSLRGSLERQVNSMGLAGRVQFTGRLDSAAQDQWYAQAQWYLSLPASDSIAVSVLEAMAHGCIPVLSDLPANHELVSSGGNGLIVPRDAELQPPLLNGILARSQSIARENRDWVRRNGLFEPWVRKFLARLRELSVRQ
jgi:glycosyltransferase involved in cell wall biosynthesis